MKSHQMRLQAQWNGCITRNLNQTKPIQTNASFVMQTKQNKGIDPEVPPHATTGRGKPEDAVVAAVHYGGDTDTTASMSGTYLKLSMQELMRHLQII